MAGVAVGTGAAAEVEWDDNTVALTNSVDIRADGEHPTGRFMPEHVIKRHLVVGPLAVALPGVPVGAAEPAGINGDDCTVRRRLRSWTVDHLKRFAVLAEDGSAHTSTP
jgi:hypothetical protein